jgi:hypothetical protein
VLWAGAWAGAAAGVVICVLFPSPSSPELLTALVGCAVGGLGAALLADAL